MSETKAIAFLIAIDFGLACSGIVVGIVAQRDNERLQIERDTEASIINRIWKQLGNPTYEELKGRSIYDLIDEIKAERDAALARVAELEAQDADRLATIARLAQELFDTRQERDALRRAQGEK
jgi:hypothetical protein